MLKIDSYEKKIIAIFARGLSKERAYEVPKPIMGKARGDVKKQLKRTLKILEGK